MLLSLVCLVVRSLLTALAPLRRSDQEREAELLVLRHQVRCSRGALAGHCSDNGTESRSPLTGRPRLSVPARERHCLQRFRRGDSIGFAAADRLAVRDRSPARGSASSNGRPQLARGAG